MTIMNYSERQKIYLYHAFIFRQPKKIIIEINDLNEEEFKDWWVELANERSRLKPIRDLWIRKKCEGLLDYHVFEEQYVNTSKHCQYCNITELQIEKLWEKEALDGKLFTKRGRGRKLELERIDPNAPIR